MNYKIYDQLPQEAKEIRIKVFMEEQGFKDEFDDLDDLCQHLVVFGNNQPIGTCRFYYDESLKSNVTAILPSTFIFKVKCAWKNCSY